ncbi:MAG: MerR family transcriptional regulator [Actinobacteria bacterium]|nr:MerR family transcriptional regulator [Actinomycetota bacterium]
MSNDSDDVYSTPVASAISGITAKTLANWKLRGIFVPSVELLHSTQSRYYYSYRDLVAIRALVVLKDFGVDLIRLAHVGAYIQSTAPLQTTFLVVDGGEVFVADGSAAVASLLRSGRRAFCVLALQAIASEVERDARALMSSAA